MNWQNVRWPTVERLRATFLQSEGAPHENYWRRIEDVETYDLTFAQRIAWKWDFVLGQLQAQHWSPPPGPVVDWGCGSGMAARRFAARYSAAGLTGIQLWDESSIALDFAAQKARAEFPQLNVQKGRRGSLDVANGTLLVSHVLNELSPSMVDELVSLASQATAVVWVEPATHSTSRLLLTVRQRLLAHLKVVAPCTHQGPCGLLDAANERHWCHHFAPSPPEVHTDGDWARFSRAAGVDLRSLPLSFLVMDRRTAAPLPAGAVRVIGHPRIYKAYALLFSCNGQGVHDRRFLKRYSSEHFKKFKKCEFDSLQNWVCDGDDVTQILPLE